MASPAAAIGTGTTIAFGTSSFSAQVLSISFDGMERPALSTAHMGTTAVQAGDLNNMTKVLGEIVDGGTVTMEIHYNPDTVVPLGAAAETVTITVNNGATAVFSGGIIGWSASIPNEEVMTGSVTVAVLGPVAITAAS